MCMWNKCISKKPLINKKTQKVIFRFDAVRSLYCRGIYPFFIQNLSKVYTNVWSSPVIDCIDQYQTIKIHPNNNKCASRRWKSSFSLVEPFIIISHCVAERSCFFSSIGGNV